MRNPALVARTLAGVQLWQLDAWAERGIVHGFAGRTGGVSPPPFDSLNVGLHVGDDPARVRENRRRLCQALGVSPGALVVGQQVHGASVARVSAAHRGRGAWDAADALPGVDALITAEPGPVLMGLFADCVPVLLLDPRTPAVGLVHAGWRGTAGQAVVRAVAAMAEAFGTDPASCQALIGPSIGPCCYTVGEDVAARFSGDMGDVVHARGHQLYLDLWAANRRLLEAAGVPANRIVIAQICTRCRMDLCFSYRGAGGRTGRMAAIIGL